MSPRRPLAVFLWCVSLFGWLSSPPSLLRAQGAGAAQATVVSDAEIQAILDGLGNPDRNVGRAALDKVQKLDADSQRKIMPNLVESFRSDSPWGGSALARVGAPAVPHLCSILRDPGTSATVMSSAIRVLMMIGKASAPAVPDLIAALVRESDRGNAIAALGTIGPDAKDAVPALRAFLQGKIPAARPGSATPTTAALVDISDQFLAVDALESIGTPEALAAVKEYKAKSR